MSAAQKVLGFTPYDELEIEAGRIGWPKTFETDLTEHDKARLQGPDAPKLFGWVLRKLGTLLLDPRMSQSGLDRYARHLASVNEGDAHRYYWHNGHELTEVGSEKMFELLHGNHNPSGVEAHEVY